MQPYMINEVGTQHLQRVCVRVSVCVCVFVFVCLTHTHSHIHIHMHTHTHTHTQAQHSAHTLAQRFIAERKSVVTQAAPQQMWELRGT